MRAIDDEIARNHGPDEIIVEVYGDPSAAARLFPHEGEYQMPSPVQPTMEEYVAAQERERLRIAELDKLPPTILRIKVDRNRDRDS
jgi:hypothetical protein